MNDWHVPQIPVASLISYHPSLGRLQGNLRGVDGASGIGVSFG